MANLFQAIIDELKNNEIKPIVNIDECCSNNLTHLINSNDLNDSNDSNDSNNSNNLVLILCTHYNICTIEYLTISAKYPNEFFKFYKIPSNLNFIKIINIISIILSNDYANKISSFNSIDSNVLIEHANTTNKYLVIDVSENKISLSLMNNCNIKTGNNIIIFNLDIQTKLAESIELTELTESTESIESIKSTESIESIIMNKMANSNYFSIYYKI